MIGCPGRHCALTWKAVSPRARSVHERARALRPRARAGHRADRFVSGSAQYPLALRTQSNVTRITAAGGVTPSRQRSATLQPGLTKARRYDGKYRAAYATALRELGLRQLVAGPACHRRLFLVVVGQRIQASTITSRRRTF